MHKLHLKPLSESRIALVGATGGLGQALTLLLCEQRPALLCLCGRNDLKLQDLALKVQSCGIECRTFAFDLRDEAEVSSAARALAALEVDRLVILSGISTTAGVLGIEDSFEIERGFAVNVLGPAKLIYQLASLFHAASVQQDAAAFEHQSSVKKPQSLQITVVSSLASLLALPSSAVYSASKAALSVYVRALSPALRSEGISFSLIHPGFFVSPMSERYQGRQMFKCSTEFAAGKVLSVMKSGKSFAAFPRSLAWGVRLLSVLPFALQTAFLQRFIHFTVKPDAERQAYMNAHKATLSKQGGADGL